jgi:hypothetical protein
VVRKDHRAEKHWKPTFERMKECRQLARHGAERWLDANSYVVPLIPRHINLMVSQLYAKDPRVVATPRKKIMYKLWDGTAQTLNAALQATTALTASADIATQGGAPVDPAMMERSWRTRTRRDRSTKSADQNLQSDDGQARQNA